MCFRICMWKAACKHNILITAASSPPVTELIWFNIKLKVYFMSAPRIKCLGEKVSLIIFKRVTSHYLLIHYLSYLQLRNLLSEITTILSPSIYLTPIFQWTNNTKKFVSYFHQQQMLCKFWIQTSKEPYFKQAQINQFQGS